MTTVSEYFAVLGLVPDKASFTVADRLLSGVAAGVQKVSGIIAGAFAVDAIAGFVHETIQALPAIKDLADQTGFTAEEIQRLGYAAGQSGADADTFNAALLKLTKNIGEAAKGGQGAVDAFAALGIEAKGIADRNPSDVLKEISDGLAKVEGPARRAEIATALLGLQGAKLVPFLKQGSQAITDLGKEAERLGLVIDKKTLDRVDALGDAMDGLAATARGAARRAFVDFVLPVLEKLVDKLKKLPDFLKRNEKAFKALGATVALVAGALAVEWLTTMAAFVAGNLIAIASNSTLTASFGVLAGAIDIGAAALVRFIARAVVAAAPVLAVAGLLAIFVLAVDDIFTTIEGGDSLFGSFSGRFDDLARALFAVVGDDAAPAFVRVLAAIGGGLASVVNLLDLGYDGMFRLIELFLQFNSAAADFINGAAFKAISAVGNFAGFSGADAFATSVTGVAAPTVARPTTTSTSTSVSVAPPTVTVTVNGAGDPEAVGNKVAGAVGAGLEQQIRAARVDRIPGAG